MRLMCADYKRPTWAAGRLLFVCPTGRTRKQFRFVRSPKSRDAPFAAVWCSRLSASRSGPAVVVRAEAQVAEQAEAQVAVQAEAVAAAAQVELAEAEPEQVAGVVAPEEQAVPVERVQAEAVAAARAAQVELEGLVVQAGTPATAAVSRAITTTM
jgi:hypothetical protein